MGKKSCPTEMLPPLLLLTSLLIQTSGLPWYFNGDYSGYYGGGGGRDYQIGPSLPSNRAGASNFNFNRAVYYPGNRAGMMESSMGAAQPGGILNRAGMMESSGLGALNRAGLGMEAIGLAWEDLSALSPTALVLFPQPRLVIAGGAASGVLNRSRGESSIW